MNSDKVKGTCNEEFNTITDLYLYIVVTYFSNFCCVKLQYVQDDLLFFEFIVYHFYGRNRGVHHAEFV